MVKGKNQGKYQKSTKWENYILFGADRISKEEATGNRSPVAFLRGNVKVQKIVLNLRTFEYGVRMLINVKVQKDIKGERKKRNRILTNTAKPAKRLGSFYMKGTSNISRSEIIRFNISLSLSLESASI